MRVKHLTQDHNLHNDPRQGPTQDSNLELETTGPKTKPALSYTVPTAQVVHANKQSHWLTRPSPNGSSQSFFEPRMTRKLHWQCVQFSLPSLS